MPLFGTSSHISFEVQFDAEPALYVLYPHASLPQATAPKTTTIAGRFKVLLKKPDRFIEVTASLRRKYFVLLDNFEYCGEIAELVIAHEPSLCLGTEKGELPSYSCKIAVDPEQDLESGIHEFPFAFDLPCTAWTRSSVIDPAPPRPGEPSINYSLTYLLELSITRRLPDGSTKVWSDAIPPLLKREQNDWKHDEEIRKYFSKKWFTIIASPVDPGELPPPLERVIEEYAPLIGPVTLIITSRAFTVGSVFNAYLNMPAVPNSSKIKQIRGLVHCDGKYISPKSNGLTVETPFSTPVFTHNDFEIEKAANGGTYSLSASITARMPNDRKIGWSTLPQTDTPIRMAHSLVFEIEVWDKDGKGSVISLKEPVTIASCVLISEWVQVPSYGSEPLPRAKFQPIRPKERFACACGFSLEQLIERENQGIMDTSDYEPPDIKPRDER